MKTYTGTKLVKAQPMTRAFYNLYRGWPAITNELDTEGYLVEYLDGGEANDLRHAGYISWSPKDIDIGDVSALQPYQVRVAAEQADLVVKISRLRVFIASPVFAAIYAGEQDRLQTQLAAMLDYSRILGERIEAFQ
jgi:hypothetical protein